MAEIQNSWTVDTLRGLLHCPVCSAPLRIPTTLPCGHTICLEHESASSNLCPVSPECSPQPNVIRPIIPPMSQVRYQAPAILGHVPIYTSTSRLDGVVSEVIALVDTVLQRKRYFYNDQPSTQDHNASIPVIKLSDDEGPSHPADPVPSGSNENDAPSFLEDDLLAAFTCKICSELLYKPVTAPCQHTFCADCLLRALDHSGVCAICHGILPSFSFFESHPANRTIELLLLTVFPDAYAARGAAIIAASYHPELPTSLFPCALVFPASNATFHLFEARYRLMLRRCLAQPVPAFGMTIPGPAAPDDGPEPEYGCMLEVRSVVMLPDGRAMIETYATHRFRVLARGALDGYAVARVERIDDDTHPHQARRGARRPESPRLGRTGPASADLMEVCHGFLAYLRRETAAWVVQRLISVYGPPPADPATFSFWMARVLPIDDEEKARLLPICSPRRRLQLVVHWIEQLNRNW